MFFTALILGFTGSMHCIGMCSPLAMAVANLSKKAWLNRLLYNAGRIFTYALLGSGAASADSLLPVSQYQNIISITLGIMLLIMGITGISGLRIPFITTLITKLTSALKRIFTHYLQKKTTGAVMLLGMINGFLPCGLTFIALMFCIALRTPWEGFIYMFLFGLGTLPAMLGLSVIINPIANKFHWRMSNVITVMMIISGCLLITRVWINHHEHHIPALQEHEIVVCR
ncbi:MAG TPA: sulfite exporter TauE/SafE family protein [Cyclobacteriaceae bacterium]